MRWGSKGRQAHPLAAAAAAAAVAAAAAAAWVAAAAAAAAAATAPAVLAAPATGAAMGAAVSQYGQLRQTRRQPEAATSAALGGLFNASAACTMGRAVPLPPPLLLLLLAMAALAASWRLGSAAPLRRFCSCLLLPAAAAVPDCLGTAAALLAQPPGFCLGCLRLLLHVGNGTVARRKVAMQH